MTSSNCLRSKPVPFPLLKGRNKNHLTCTEMVCQHLKDKLTGSPRLSPLHCSLQKTFFGFIYIHAAILPSTGAHLPVTSGSTTPWTHPFALQGVSIRLLKEHSSIRQHKTKEINGGEEKKAYTPNPQSLHHKHSHCQHLKHHCHGNHGTFSPADRRAGKETLVSSLLAG